ncbi:sulfotransferase [Thioclava litoralis]|uniref:Sulfotransferase n=1 Tax=Thioclava litoralis TaxID=3076557 RepID=A0ABZ1E0J7_9RHOB|nr:sulfotransferase [Thioclava sp. FTW29]
MDITDLDHDEDVSLALAVLDGDHRAALKRIETLWSQNGPSSHLMMQAIRSSWALGQDGEARKLSEEAVTLWPEVSVLWGMHAAILTAFGDVEGAVAAYDRALSFRPDDVQLLSGRNRLRRFSATGPEWRRLAQASRDEATSLGQKVMSEFALGAIEDAAGEYAAAFAHFQRGNDLKARGYDPHLIERRLHDQLAQCPDLRSLPERVGMAGEPRMVFIGGLPRSGTTLTEQILIRHDKVSTLGEACDFRLSMIELMHAEIGAGTAPLDYWRWFSQPGRPLIHKLGQIYRRRIAARGQTTPYILSKMPLDLSHAAVLRAMLPEARFICVNRHPLDVGLSLFMTDFADGHGFSEKLEWIAHMVRATDRSMCDYAQKLGPAFRMQSLRALVEQPAQEIPRLLDHLGLAMQPACLEPKAAQGAVRTASDVRVRRKINREGVGYWRRYEAQLQPLIEALGRDWIAAWEERDADRPRQWEKAS